jgi:hypothetical protein
MLAARTNLMSCCVPPVAVIYLRNVCLLILAVFLPPSPSPGYMNVALEQTEEYVDGHLKAKHGDSFIRGNNILYISTQKRKAKVEA